MRSASIWLRVFASARRCSSGDGDCSAAVSNRVLMVARSMGSPFQNSAPSPSMEISILSALGCCTAAVAFGKSILIACVCCGVVFLLFLCWFFFLLFFGFLLFSVLGPGVTTRKKSLFVFFVL